MRTNIAKVKKKLDEIFQGCFDVGRREITTLDGRSAIVMFIDGLVNKETIQNDVIRPLLGFSFDSQIRPSADNLNELKAALLSPVDVRMQKDFDSAVMACLSGDTVLFGDGMEGSLVIQTRGWNSRGISSPETEQTVRGPKEGFTETMLFNVAMVRRKLRSPQLKTQILQMGEQTGTDVCVMYLEGTAPKELVARVLSRLRSDDARYILESGHIEQFIEDDPHTLFATIGNHERPDTVAAKLLKGRVAIIVDGTPFVLTLPMLFVENFHSAEDFYSRPYYAVFLRILRIFAYVVGLTLPAVYICIVMFTREIVPDPLLVTLIEASEGAAFSPITEITLMLLMYELLREAMIRLPVQIGSSVSIAGVFIIGEAAVGVHLITAPSIVVAAMTFIASAVVNSTADSSVLIRFLLLILAGIFGIYGIMAGAFLIIVHLCSLTSFGEPYLYPFSPFKAGAAKRSIFRTRNRCGE